MIHSMTGYGKALANYEDKKIHVEVKSLNSKNLDLTLRVAPLYREREMEIRQKVAQSLIRGKVDMMIWIERDNASTGVKINGQAIATYYNQLREIVETNGIPAPPDYLATIMRMPETTGQCEQETLDEAEWDIVKAATDEAIDNLIKFRKQEGVALEKMFLDKLNNIESYLNGIIQYEPERLVKIKNRLLENLSQLPDVKYDNNRFEQELIYYIEKLDISEEKQRLTNHLQYFRTTLNEQEGQGKKLGFIAQEMGREINTTGSKSNHAEMQNLVVKMKDELEQIKEQVLNVL